MCPRPPSELHCPAWPDTCTPAPLHPSIRSRAWVCPRPHAPQALPSQPRNPFLTHGVSPTTASRALGVSGRPGQERALGQDPHKRPL